ncbi:MAG TPA: DUF2335 domain-containing protein [Vicinamibacterales bacterium]|nr:DUF2335 domain-containing protein [Vicinamibacterales bacterium]
MSKRKPPGLIRNPPPSSPVRTETQEITLHRGPLPAPEVLEAFDRVLPGLANRIVTMAEGNATDRWRTNRANRIKALMGPIFAFIAAMTVFVGAFYLILNGFEIVGLTALVAELVGLVGAFIYGRRTAA